MKKPLVIALILSMLLCNLPTLAETGAVIRINGTDALLELQLFTASFDNWELMSSSLDYPEPDEGAFYMVRFALPEGSEAMSYDEILTTIIPSLRLRAMSDGETYDVFEFTVPDWDGSRVFDVFFYCSISYELADMELICDEVPYTLAGLSRDVEPLTGAHRNVAALKKLHKLAKYDNGNPIDAAACSGNVIVGWFTDSDDDAAPRVITADSVNEWDFPLEYRAESFDTARWAAIIHPTYKQVGWYSGLAAGPANETTTWLSLFDLETDMLYEVKVATEAPPQTISVQTINGFVQHSGASGAFRGDEALALLTELVETARVVPTPTL